MSLETPMRQNPDRESIVAAHPQREAFETACSAWVILRKVAHRFGLPSMALYRYPIASAAGRAHGAGAVLSGRGQAAFALRSERTTAEAAQGLRRPTSARECPGCRLIR